MNAAEISKSLSYLKSKSSAAHVKAQTLNLNNGKLIVNNQGPYAQILASLEEINTTAGNLQHDLTTKELSEKDSASVAESYKDFVRAHQLLLHLLTAKASMFVTGQPVADVLRIEKDILDTLGESIGTIVPSKKADLKTQQQSLSRTLNASIKAHERTSLF